MTTLFLPAPLGPDFAKRAKAALEASPPRDPEFTSDKDYRQAKAVEFNTLCHLAKEACEQTGHRNRAPDILQLHMIYASLISCWIESPELLGHSNDIVERVQRRKRGEKDLTTEQVVAIMQACWKVVVDLLRYYGLCVKTHGSEAEMLREFHEVVRISRGVQQKIGMGTWS